MRLIHSFRSFMLVLITLFTFETHLVYTRHSAQALHHRHHHIGHWRLAERDVSGPNYSPSVSKTTTSCIEKHCARALPVPGDLPCGHINGTTFEAGSEMDTWVMLCDIDFYAQDILPFLVAQDFQQCLQFCQDHNIKNGNGTCAGFVFAPGRIGLENDCYLKSSLHDTVDPSTIHLIGAILVPKTEYISRPPVENSLPSQAGSEEATSDDSDLGPVIVEAKSLGASTNDPSTQYVVHSPAVPKKLAKALVNPGINLDLVTKYPLAADTGSWTTNSLPLDSEFGNMTLKPRLSRDGGRGGNINGTHIFMFCDTATFGNVDTAYMGFMNGLVSSSAAIVSNANPLEIEKLVLRDDVGQWQDDVGRLRGWLEQTTGEESFNIQVSGDGFRYAIWPDSSLIPLNDTTALIYAPVVYVEVNMTTQKSVFFSVGNSLVLISTDPLGPHADRLVNLLFQSPEVEWGSLAGLRSWGASGNTTLDGTLYLFGQVERGILVAKVDPHSISDRSAYQYWAGDHWTMDMPDRNSTAFLIEQPVMSFDIFYSPFHQYFIMVYMTPYADNIFWFRYLKVPVANKVVASYMPGGDPNYCERILQDEWSEPRVLWKIDPPKIGYAYAGGAHMGFFGADDIIYGGNYLLLTWTEHTDVDPNDPASGYAHKAARIRLS